MSPVPDLDKRSATQRPSRRAHERSGRDPMIVRSTTNPAPASLAQVDDLRSRGSRCHRFVAPTLSMLSSLSGFCPNFGRLSGIRPIPGQRDQ
jgi:hypothetical protein